MALNIKDPVTDRLVRELAELTGESITTATRKAVEQRLEIVRLRSRPKRDLRGIIERGRARTVRDTRTPDEIIGYNVDGIPN